MLERFLRLLSSTLARTQRSTDASEGIALMDSEPLDPKASEAYWSSYETLKDSADAASFMETQQLASPVDLQMIWVGSQADDGNIGQATFEPEQHCFYQVEMPEPHSFGDEVDYWASYNAAVEMDSTREPRLVMGIWQKHVAEQSAKGRQIHASVWVYSATDSEQEPTGGRLLFLQSHKGASLIPPIVQSVSQAPAHIQLIDETSEARLKLKEAALATSDGQALRFGRMLTTIDEITAELKKDPHKLFEVQRLFTYYLPEVGRLLDARLRVASLNDTDRLASIDGVLNRIEVAFEEFRQRMHKGELQELDVDLRLLDQSLAAEFEIHKGQTE